MARGDFIDLTVHVHKVTAGAVRVSDDGEDKNAKWLPRSQVQFDGDVEDCEGKVVTLGCKEWLAEREGLI